MPARRTQTARGYRNSRAITPGDTLLVHSIDRLCRNMSDMCAVTTRLRDQGVTLIFLKEQLTFSAGTNNPMQELQLHMMSAFSQFERALLKERQADGIAAKKARVKTGRPGADIKRSVKLTHSEAEGQAQDRLRPCGPWRFHIL
nr:recombinase family protein [Klebsiella pneumoniae]